MTADLIFENPPAVDNCFTRKPGSTPLGQWLAALRNHPGRSSRFTGTLKSPSGAASAIKQGRAYGVEKGEFTASTRKGALYASYLGPVKTPEPSEESKAIVASISQAASNLDPETRRLLAQAFAEA